MPGYPQSLIPRASGVFWTPPDTVYFSFPKLVA